MSDARRTFADYKTQVLHALGNPDEADLDITAASIVNDALEHIAAMHEWNWLTTGQVSLDITADQDYVELPADFGALVALEHSEGWARSMIPTTWQDLLRMRQDVIHDWTWSYWYVINTGNVEVGQEDAGLTLATLNLYPTPADDFPGALSMVYRRFLRRLKDDTDRPQWPAYMDRPLSLLARAFASTDYDDDPESAYTQEFRRVIGDCISKDGLMRKSFGQMRSGLFGMPQVISPFYPRSIPDPVQK